MADFLDEPNVKCNKHGRQFLPEQCSMCATLVNVNDRIRLLADLADAVNNDDPVKIQEFSEKMERQIIVDELFRDHKDE